MIAILGAGSQRLDCWSFYFSLALVPTTDSTGERLISYSGG